MLRRNLACSFCKRGADDVQKLVAGPGVYICDQCAAQVIRIMESHTDGTAPPSNAQSGLLGRVLDRIRAPWRGEHQRCAAQA